MKRRQYDTVFRAIADPTRREILGLLRLGPRTVGEIAANFPTSRPAISKHLRLLRTAGLVVSHQDGTTRICDLNAKPLRAVDLWIKDYEEFWVESMRSLKRFIEDKESEAARQFAAADRPTRRRRIKQPRRATSNEC